MALQTAIREDLTPSPVLSVDNKLPFGDSESNTPVTKNKMPKGLNTPVPTGYALQAPMGTVMSQKALKKLPSPVQPTSGPVVNRQLSYGARVPDGTRARRDSKPDVELLESHQEKLALTTRPSCPQNIG